MLAIWQGHLVTVWHRNPCVVWHGNTFAWAEPFSVGHVSPFAGNSAGKTRGNAGTVTVFRSSERQPWYEQLPVSSVRSRENAGNTLCQTGTCPQDPDGGTPSRRFPTANRPNRNLFATVFWRIASLPCLDNPLIVSWCSKDCCLTCCDAFKIGDLFLIPEFSYKTVLHISANIKGMANRGRAHNEALIGGGESVLDMLPDELIELIVLPLPVAAVVALGACCVRLRCLTSSDAVWRRLYETDFPRGRTSLGGLACWRDVYRRAVRSVPSSNSDDAVHIFDVDQSSLPARVAFDPVRHEVVSIVHRFPTHELRAAGMDGITVRRADDDESFRELGVDRNTGTYIAVTESPVRIHVLDPNFHEIQPSVDVSDVFEVALVAVRPNGRLFLVPRWARAYDVLSIDPLAGTIDLLPSTARHNLAPVDGVADERDCLLIATASDLITIDSDGNQVAALPIKCDRVAISRDGIVAALLSGTNFREVHFFASSTVESSPIGRYVLPSARGRAIAHMVWSDERLLLWVMTT
eukprot:TRINITY_DN787_c1_g3_i3.p1 TRINITY_DN787_c1_g3~~TRINITY_DN787_c1_g3_i3.p1  ORF type:complete len:522 (-),score=13.87 TRINITY_DN787_c1_g3_i3:156-1721(-)